MQIQMISTVGNVAEYIYINLCEGSEIWRGLNIFKEVPKTIFCKKRRSLLLMYGELQNWTTFHVIYNIYICPE